jgi:hypothetical protein
MIKYEVFYSVDDDTKIEVKTMNMIEFNDLIKGNIVVLDVKIN